MKRPIVVASIALLIGACGPSPSASTSNQAASPAAFPSGASSGPRAAATGNVAFAAPNAAARRSVTADQKKKIKDRPVCPKVAKHAVRCGSHVLTDETGKPLTFTSPNAVLSYGGGLGPAEFHTAYRLPYYTAVQQTIAIVNWGDDPTAKQDLDNYNAAFGLPYFPTCTTTGWAICFQKVNQFGSTSIQSLPSLDHRTVLETSMDVQIAHQACLNCKILLVEARINLNDPNGPDQADLAAAENMAARLGATQISNSWGAPDGDLTQADWNTLPRSAYDHPGIAITVSSGDDGYGTSFPADLNTVVAVGGTTLYLNADNSYSFESAWSGSGSGCNLNALARGFQTLAVSWPSAGCGGQRGVADVAADADPYSGAWVYDSTPNPTTQFAGGWVVEGGTSLSAPLIAGVYALAGNAWTVYYPAQLAYQHAGSLHDIASGSNDPYAGAGCGYYGVCVSGPGYDGPTGLGTPDGLGGF